jgi:hypothetical protein
LGDDWLKKETLKYLEGDNGNSGYTKGQIKNLLEYAQTLPADFWKKAHEDLCKITPDLNK